MAKTTETFYTPAGEGNDASQIRLRFQTISAGMDIMANAILLFPDQASYEAALTALQQEPKIRFESSAKPQQNRYRITLSSLNFSGSAYFNGIIDVRTMDERATWAHIKSAWAKSQQEMVRDFSGSAIPFTQALKRVADAGIISREIIDSIVKGLDEKIANVKIKIDECEQPYMYQPAWIDGKAPPSPEKRFNTINTLEPLIVAPDILAETMIGMPLEEIARRAVLGARSASTSARATR